MTPADASTTARPNRAPPILWIAFFLSGVAGLSYELVWVRYVAHLAGGSTRAIAATVAIFFAGLALGSWAGSYVFARARRPLATYAALEGLIGLLAFAVPSLMHAFEGVTASATGLWAPLALAGAVLLPATALLGATFPGMAAIVARLTEAVGGTARFYGFNTAGAVAGCLLTSLLLLPNLGLHLTNTVMVGVDLFVALLTFGVQWRLAPVFSQLFDAHEVQVLDKAPHDVSHEHDSARENVHEAPAPPTPHEVKDILPPNHARGLALVSGFLAIGVEVLWTRALSLSFPATVYVFAIVVAAYLFGIATGALFLPRLPRGVRPLRLLAILYGIAGVGIIISLFAFPRLASWFYDLVGAGDIATWQGWIAGIAATSLLAMLPATIAMGAALPLLIGLASESRQRSRIAGQLYMFNVLGGVFGSLLTTFTLMPSLGLSRTITSLALGYLILALSLTRRARIRPSATLAVVLLLIAGATGVALGVVPEIDPSTSSDPRRTRLYASDDAGASIAIYQFGPKQRVPIRSLKVNNFYGLNVTAPSTIAMQYRLGYLPLALHPNPKRALLVGFATGNTLAAMADVKTVHHLDCVEIYGSLFKLAPYFEAANEDVWRRSKVHLIVEDGRRFMSRPRPRYDVIVGDLYLPRNPGVGSLYSVEYFRATRARLNPGGVFVAWLPLWQLSPTEAGIIIKTFLAVFPKARGLFGNPSRSRPVLGLTGTRVAKAFSPTLRAQETSGASLQHQVEQRVHNALVRIYGAGAARPPARSLRFPPLLSHEILQSWADGKRINTLDNALIEYSAPRTLLRYQLRRITPAGDNLRHIDALIRRSRGQAHPRQAHPHLPRPRQSPSPSRSPSHD